MSKCSCGWERYDGIACMNKECERHEHEWALYEIIDRLSSENYTLGQEVTQLKNQIKHMQECQAYDRKS